MSKESRQNRCKALYEQFVSLNPKELEIFPQAFSDFDGLNLDETRKTLRFVLDTFDGLSINDAWGDLTWHAYNSIEGVLQNVHSSYAQLRTSRDQGSF